MDEGREIAAKAAEETDERLAALAAGGDEGAFELLVLRHRSHVYRLCAAAAGNHADADDAAQETFVRLLRSLGAYERGRPFLPWLRKIAWNAALSVRRGVRSTLPLGDGEGEVDAPDRADGPETLALRAEESRLLSDAVSGLPPELRTVLVLRVVEGLSYAEIAEAAGVPPGTVMSRLHRARERLVTALRGAPREGRDVLPPAGAGGSGKGRKTDGAAAGKGGGG